MYYFLNPVAAPATDTVSGVLIFLGVVFFIAAIISVVNFALKQANDRNKYKISDQSEETEKNDAE